VRVRFGSLRAANRREGAMNQTERYYRIDQLIRDRGLISFADLQRELEVSRATLRRDLTHLRDRLNAPIVYDRDAGGYRYEKQRIGPRFQLPGLWFSADECLALLTMHQVLQGLDAGGLLGRHVAPLVERLEMLLDSEQAPAKEVLKRIRLLPAQRRPARAQWFEVVGRALLSRRRLRIDYFTRHRNERSTREVSPQRLVFYRGNWYLDAWCHRAEALRMFALDSMKDARLLDARAKEVSLKQVDEEMARGYGIYRGARLTWATLVFSAEAARWVRAEVWHERQQGRELPDGRYELRVPYADSRELEMDVLRHGEHVEVVAPAELRARIAQRLATAARRYA
jgi:predicted DNA-binding transcriptional regulator YafY